MLFVPVRRHTNIVKIRYEHCDFPRSIREFILGLSILGHNALCPIFKNCVPSVNIDRYCVTIKIIFYIIITGEVQN